MENLMSVQKVSAFLSVHPNTVYRLVESGDLPAIKIGGQWRFFPEDLRQWLTAQRVGVS